MSTDEFPVQRPDSLIILAIDAALTEIDNLDAQASALQAQIDALKKKISDLGDDRRRVRAGMQEIARGLINIPDNQQRLAVAKFLYHKRRDVRPAVLIGAFFGISEENAAQDEWRARFLNKCGPIGWGPCATEGCASMVPIMSMRGGRHPRTCDSCVAARREVNALNRTRSEQARRVFDRRQIEMNGDLDAVVDLLGLSEEDLHELVVAGHDRLFAGPSGGGE